MILQTAIATKAKPFLKWAGGKTQLLPTIDIFLPESIHKEKSVTYIEPFIGGGAMLFFMLQKYPNINRAIINDINPHLINAYKVVRDNPIALIETLERVYQNEDFGTSSIFKPPENPMIWKQSIFGGLSKILDSENE